MSENSDNNKVDLDERDLEEFVRRAPQGISPEPLAVPNTHKPPDEPSAEGILLDDGVPDTQDPPDEPPPEPPPDED